MTSLRARETPGQRGAVSDGVGRTDITGGDVRPETVSLYACWLDQERAPGLAVFPNQYTYR